MLNEMIVKLSAEEDKRSEELMKQLKWYEAKVDAVKKELRIIIYKLDRKP